MPLFQKSILSDYLASQDEPVVTRAYKKFTAYFHEAGVQRNIRKSHEEQFQATFLSRLFVDALGYTLFPDTAYNLTTEVKNEVDELDKQIDEMVYDLYGLTEEERRIVENLKN
ncbi:MAG: hypothetical protein U5L96_05965 [Owenweeksia sp.]|nr:hypothetical protein [Owenweeksia sp.]